MYHTHRTQFSPNGLTEHGQKFIQNRPYAQTQARAHTHTHTDICIHACRTLYIPAKKSLDNLHTINATENPSSTELQNNAVTTAATKEPYTQAHI